MKETHNPFSEQEMHKAQLAFDEESKKRQEVFDAKHKPYDLGGKEEWKDVFDGSGVGEDTEESLVFESSSPVRRDQAENLRGGYTEVAAKYSIDDIKQGLEELKARSKQEQMKPETSEKEARPIGTPVFNVHPPYQCFAVWEDNGNGKVIPLKLRGGESEYSWMIGLTKAEIAKGKPKVPTFQAPQSAGANDLAPESYSARDEAIISPDEDVIGFTKEGLPLYRNDDAHPYRN